MAIAIQPPHITAQQNRQADLARRMNSVDPVTRYKAKEEAMDSYAADFGKAIVAQAEQNAKAYQEQMRFYERSDRENNPYKPLPAGVKVVNSK